MILYDFSSAIHRSLHTAIKHTQPHKYNGKYITSEFISVLIYRIVDELIEFYKQYKKTYGDFVICLDNHSKPYWRKSIYYAYKANRKKERDSSDVDYNEVFKHIEVLITTLQNWTSFKVIGVPGVEADDIIGLLTRKYAKFEKVLILSPDKDFKQLHSLGEIRQYSSITNKWITPENLEEWKLEHILCGDSTDNVPRVVDFLDFTPDFRAFLASKNINLTELQWFELPEESKAKLSEAYHEVYPDSKTHEKPRFGMSFVKKHIKEFGSLDAWLDSNPLLRKTFELNQKLVIDDYVPPKIEAEIVGVYINPKNSINMDKLKLYFDYYDLSNSCLPLFTDFIQQTEAIVSWEDSKRIDFNNVLM